MGKVKKKGLFVALSAVGFVAVRRASEGKRSLVRRSLSLKLRRDLTRSKRVENVSAAVTQISICFLYPPSPSQVVESWCLSIGEAGVLPGIFRATNKSNMHVFGEWEETQRKLTGALRELVTYVFDKDEQL